MADGVNEYYDFGAELPAAADLSAVHLLAIGGSGMSGVARLFLARGMTVTGTDGADVPVLASLREAGAQVQVGYAAEHVRSLAADTLVVVSSAIRPDNPELVAARERGLRVLHRSQGLAVLMADRAGIAVAGANGKTTTSAMAVMALLEAGAQPSFAIGADIVGPGVNAAPGDGRAFVVEADESDGSFVVYHPDIAVVTNIREDHLDFYGSFENVQRAYREFAATIGEDGVLVCCQDDAGSAALAVERKRTGQRVLTYGRSADADLVLSQEWADGLRQGAHVTGPHDIDLDFTLKVPGSHNLLNAAGVLLALVAGLGQAPQAVASGLSAFAGSSRRFEPRGSAGGVRVVDDYAHNPGKLEAAVRTGLGQRGDGRLVVAFQPHLYSRTRDAADGLAQALTEADVVVVLDVYGAREEPMPGVTGRLISDQVPGAHFAPDLDQAERIVLEQVRPGDLVLTVGAGDITTLGPRLLSALAAAE
ncbi:UDP-N-acetylmuramate--L-alanine ligase [Dermacoccaceae bacterium W4C1]